MKLQRLIALIRKETIQILRDRRFILLFLGLVFVQLFIYGYSASKTVYHLQLAVVDESRSPQSLDLVQALVNSQYFDLTEYLPSEADIVHAINYSEVKAGIVILPDFASKAAKGSADFLMVLDGSDQFAVRSAYNAAALVAQNLGLRISPESVVYGNASLAARGAGGGPLLISTRVLYNPDLNDKWFVIPGIIGMILQSLAVEQAAIFVVRDREWGTFEQILATPVRRLELILGKLLPLLALLLLALGLSIALGVFWFGVPFQGGLLLFFGLGLLFIASCLGLGLWISTRAKTQFDASVMSLFFLLFGLLLSGLFYPRIGMPLVPQLVGDLAPLTYFLRIARGIYTKGIGLHFLWGDALALVIYLLVVTALAARNFKMRLD